MKRFAALGILLLSGCAAERGPAPVVVAPPVAAKPPTRRAVVAPVQQLAAAQTSYLAPGRHSAARIVPQVAREDDSLVIFLAGFINIKAIQLRGDSPIRDIKKTHWQLLRIREAYKSRKPQTTASRYAIMSIKSLGSAISCKEAMTGGRTSSPENSDRLKKMESHLKEAVRYSEWYAEAAS
jgi:hypothetical protein